MTMFLINLMMRSRISISYYLLLIVCGNCGSIFWGTHTYFEHLSSLKKGVLLLAAAL